jgi:hypothetical protein
MARRLALIAGILAFDKGPGVSEDVSHRHNGILDLHDKRHSPSTIYANAEFLGRQDTCVPGCARARQTMNCRMFVGILIFALSCIGRGACQSPPDSPNVP